MKKHGEQNRIPLRYSIIVKLVLLTTVIIGVMALTGIYSAPDQLVSHLLIAGIICWIVGLLLGIIICLPLWKMARIVRLTSELDLRPESDELRLARRKDEIGMLSLEMQKVREAFRAVLLQIDETGCQIDHSVAGLRATIEQINSVCMNNSSASAELSAGMEGAANSINCINADMQTAKNEADQISSMAEQGSEASATIMDRAVNLGSQTDKASADTLAMYNVVKERTDKAMESSKAVEHIDKLIEGIQNISSQITLLSLNASIEAARAGDAGKGFAVVAREVKELAGKTDQTIADINNIVGEVKVAVNAMSECISDVTQFLERKVLVDYQEFGVVSKQYQEDADLFKNSMTQIRESISLLSDTMDSTAGSVDSIRTTVDNSASASADIAGKTSALANQVHTNYEMVKDCTDCVAKLQNAVSQFKLS